MNKLNELIDLLNELPGIGKKSAKRLAIKLIESKDLTLDTLVKVIDNIKILDVEKNTGLIIENGEITFNVNKPLMIVQNNLDAEAYRELFGDEFNYFNLNINTIADISRSLVSSNKVEKLIEYIKLKEIKELIFGLSPKRESEIIINLLSNEIYKELRDITISKIATGVPVGGTIEHIDSKTMRKAVEKREKI